MTTWTNRNYKQNEVDLKTATSPLIDEGGKVKDIKQDSSTEALTIIEYEHHELHGGSSYTVSDVVNVSSTTVKWLISTPDSEKYAHFQPSVECTGEMYEIFTEGADRTHGTGLTVINRRRVSSSTSGCTVSRTPTGGSTDGTTTLRTLRVGSTGVGSKTISGGGSRATSEFILKPNTKYVLSITTYANVYVSLHLDWYMHADK